MSIKQCPECNSFNIYVTDSRERKKVLKRKRKCQDCGHTFSTVEITEEHYNNLIMESENIREAREDIKKAIDLLDKMEVTP